ncbi:hypothetical protein SAMN04489859_103138 [Paracoccus alcaliphilus]|uniref:Holin-X, holin superfamily III n=1 Tax=Paracoccus alcaliphilus TaxID=34002 RepID=A0A1H8LJW7_9RHOB|nr:hypothetical protein [Paracoccus alcaliphilus]WCR19738.1 hypothetical protein JHW40_08915 [Paracoccus alcaliphilus]SEO05407.1 hypothetical protein SAMN04489859_103138 [Paracoccus alcaliphilus]
MVWVQRVTGAVFAIGVVALIAAVVTMAMRADSVPPLPIYAGILGLVALILLAGACMALISIAISARRGSEALWRLAKQGGTTTAAIGPARPFSAQPLREAAQPEPAEPASTRPPRPSGRRLVAER